MAPEALSREVAEGAAALLDVYAAGVLAYELLCGIMPFDSADPHELYRAKIRKPLPQISKRRPDVSPPLDDLVLQMMAVDPNDRPQGAEALLWQLRSLRARLETQGEARPMCALIVDDDEDVRTALALYVRAAAPECEIETCDTGRAAVRAVRRRVPDLLLLDLDLPDINGIEVCMLLRGMQLGDGCRIVSVSARATRADVELLQQLGVRSLVKGAGLMNQVVEMVQQVKQS
jgi:CheY-like chemotaxis protein